MGLEQALRNVTDVTDTRPARLRRPWRRGRRRWLRWTWPKGSEMTTVTTGGVVTALVRRYTRRGELMATFVLEDLEPP